MSVQVPILQRHKDEAFKAFGVVNGTIHEACAQACANVDFERLANDILRIFGSHANRSFAISAILAREWKDIDLRVKGIAETYRLCGPKEALSGIKELVLSCWGEEKPSLTSLRETSPGFQDLAGAVWDLVGGRVADYSAAHQKVAALLGVSRKTVEDWLYGFTRALKRSDAERFVYDHWER